MSDDGCSSDDEIQRDLNLRHSIELRLDLETEDKARIVCEVLSVDKEPSRSNAVRELRHEGQFLLISIKAEDRRSLQKSTANLLDMCDLSMSTLDLTLSKKWLIEPNQKVSKDKKEKKNEKQSGDHPMAKKHKLGNGQS